MKAMTILDVSFEYHCCWFASYVTFALSRFTLAFQTALCLLSHNDPCALPFRLVRSTGATTNRSQRNQPQKHDDVDCLL